MKKLVFLFLYLLLAYNPLQAQKKPCFKILDAGTGQEINAGCVGQRIRVVNCEAVVTPTTIQYFDFNYDDGVPFKSTDTVNTHTYTQAKTYRISFLPVDPNSSVSDSTSRAFTVLPLPKPAFTATSCSQGNVRVTITDQHYNTFLVDFGDGTTRTLARGGSTSHQFAPGQPRKVVVTVKYNQATLPICAVSEEAPVQDLPLPPLPRFTKVQVLVPAPDGRISFTLDQLEPSYYYLIEKQTGSGFTTLDTIKNPAAAQITQVLTQVNARDQACYRVRATDPCGTVLNAVSNTVCSLPLTIGANQEIVLSWPAYPEPDKLINYQLYRDGKLYRSLAKDQHEFTDERVICQQQHCYELVALLSNNIQSVANKPCITVNTSRPPARPFLTSTFTPDNQILIGLQVPASQLVSQVTWQKSVDGAGFQNLAISKTAAHQDSSFKNNQVFCYQAAYRDSCNQTSPASNQTCPIFLKASPQDNSTILLSWSAYVGFTEPLQYVVQKIDANGQVLSSQPAGGNAYTDTFNPAEGQRIFYRIQGLAAGQQATYSNTERVVFEAKPLIPTAFTPNGDNLNDLFEVKGRFIQVTRFTIYDRWGQIIYQSQGQGWNGQIKGKPAPTGTYPYSVSWKEDNGLINTKTGIVSLLR